MGKYLIAYTDVQQIKCKIPLYNEYKSVSQKHDHQFIFNLESYHKKGNVHACVKGPSALAMKGFSLMKFLCMIYCHIGQLTPFFYSYIFLSIEILMYLFQS